MAILPEKTIHYKTYVKAALVDALRQSFEDHPDTRIAKTKITIEYPTSQNSYPAIIVRFFERNVKNAGVGHIEYIWRDGDGQTSSQTDPYKHYLYDGDIEFAIFALSSLDRDLISDSLVQTLAMGELLEYTQPFHERIYNQTTSLAKLNYVNLNTDLISGFGETQTPQPWLSEDQLVYQTSYRAGITGEFYSLPPVDPATTGMIEHYNLYPYTEGDSIPTGTVDSSDWS